MPLTVSSDFPGGNIIVQNVKGSHLTVRPDLRDTQEWWFWWNFRVHGAAGQELHVVFDDGRGPVGPNGPALRIDDQPWHWAWQPDGAGACLAYDSKHFIVRIPAHAHTVQLAFSFPYQLADYERFIAGVRGRPELRESVLATTRAGRPAPLLTIGSLEKARHVVLLCARHHACESIGSFILEGILDYALSTEARTLRETTALVAVPMVDFDGVEAGDQGKARRPHDHNRDYIDEPLYPTVRGIQRLMSNIPQLALYLDLHCPWIRKGPNEASFLVLPPEPYAAATRQFGTILRQLNDSPIPYTGQHDIAFGVDWNVTPAAGLKTSTGYCRNHDRGMLRTALTVETSYSISEGAVVTPDAARHWGRALGRTMGPFLDSSA